jgi:hypothetical protein
MASLYLTNVTGNGQTTATAWRPAGFDGKRYAVLMMDEIKGKAVVFSPDDTVTGTGITRFLQAANRAALVNLAKTTGPTAGQRTTITNWCTNAGYTVPNYSGSPTWWTVVHFLARQVNGTADLDGINAV